MKALFSFLAERLKKLSPNTILLVGLVYILSLAAMDYHTPLGMSFTLFYFFGIAFVAWGAGPWHATLLSALATAAIFGVEWSLLRPLMPGWAIVWNVSTRLFLFTAAAWLIAELTRLARRLAGLVEERTTQWKAEAEALQASQRQLADAMDLARLASWEYDVPTALFSFDPRFYALYATTAEREGGNQMSAEAYAREFLFPEDAPLVSEGIARALAATDPNFKAQVEHRIRRRDGATRHLLVRVAVTRDAAGRTVKLRGVNQDITERKLMEEALRQSEERNRAIVATAMDGFALVDSAGRLLDVNAAYSRISGYSPEELLRLRIPDLEAAESPAQVAQHLDSLKKAGGRFESRQRRKDGREINVEVSVSPAVQLGGLFCCFTRDITERKEAEQRLLGAMEMNRTLIAASSIGIAAFKASGECVLANEALAGIIGGSFLHKNFRDLESWRRQGLLQQADTVLNTRQPCQIEFHGITFFGKEVFLSLHFTPFITNAELHLLLLVSDIAERKRTEEALKLQALVLQNMAEGVLLLAPDNTIQFANPALEATFGYQPGALTGQDISLLNAWPAEESARFNQQVARSAAANGLWNGEYLNQRKDGTLFTSEARISTLNLRGQTFLVCVQQDISERKRAEENLQLAQRLQKAILDNIPDPAWLKDAQGRFLACNEPLARFYGRTPQDILGRTVFDLAPQEATRLAHEDKEALATGKPVRMEVPFTDTQGQVHWFDTVKSPLFTHRGEANAIVGIAHETTRRHQMEEALRESEERYRSLLNNLNVGIYRNTPAPPGRFIQVNPALARMHGYDSLEEFQQIPVSDHYQNPADREAFLARILRHGTVLNHELRLKRKSGAPILASVTATAHRNPDGEVDWIDGVIEDITERQRLERQILEISDREQARIGQDLHDGLCQQLVSLAFDANSLKRDLPTESRSGTLQARRIADLLDEAITEARQLARGLFPSAWKRTDCPRLWKNWPKRPTNATAFNVVF